MPSPSRSQAKQQVLCAEVMVVELSRLVHRQFDHALGFWSEADSSLAAPSPCGRPRPAMDSACRATAFNSIFRLFSTASCHAVPFAHKAQENMLRANAVVI